MPKQHFAFLFLYKRISFVVNNSVEKKKFKKSALLACPRKQYFGVINTFKEKAERKFIFMNKFVLLKGVNKNCTKITPADKRRTNERRISEDKPMST